MKTFRLFISSTFKDFKIERDLLQTRIFPHLLKLCAEHSYGFLPIDLRWGVTEGAQYDQKTLELCLGEVRSCTVEPHPDFLIFAGDRYGWIPLPYRIDQSEFKEIISKIPNEDLSLVEEWYRLDLNQLPAAYTLQKREGRFQQYDTWVTVEDSLRTIFQSAVLKTSLDDRTKEKYFTSTTEFEYEEFRHRVKDDQKSIFLLSRILESNGIKNVIYASDNDYQVVFKNRLKQTISSDNQIELKAILEDTDSFDDSYIESFVENITSMLSASISLEIEQIKLLESQSENELHKQRMLELYQFVVGRDNELEAINTYINDPHVKLPFILYGSSGIGKSAIMAKSISAIITSSTQQVLYRFCGISEQSSSIRSVMISLLGEIGIVIDVPKESDELKSLSSIDEPKIDRISEAISDALWRIKTPTVIFIDALDQLSDKNKLEWLPSVLPDHLKIVLSVLKDDKYPDDEYYYEKLLTLYPENAFYSITTLDDLSIAETIITEILRGCSRTLQPNQMQYVLDQYAKVNKPFYLKIVCEEIRNWDSETTEFALANDQNSVVKEYIENLSTLYHHDTELVKKVFGYIYVTRESLSESQLYEILSNDTDLVSRLEHTDHTNHEHKLPMAVWARLKTYIEPFIREGEGGKLQFFHREFIDGAKSCYNYELSQHLLHILEQMIENKELSTIYEQITDLHIKVLTTQKKEYPENSIDGQCKFMLTKAIKDEMWVDAYLTKTLSLGEKYWHGSEDKWTIVFYEIALIISKILYEENSVRWVKLYIESLNELSIAYSRMNSIDESVIMQQTALKTLQPLYDENPKKWAILYITSLNNLAESNRYLKKIDESMGLESKALEILQKLYDDNPKQWAMLYTTLLNNFSESCSSVKKIDDAVKYSQTSVVIREKLYEENADQWVECYTISINNLAEQYRYLNRIDQTLKLHLNVIKIREKLYVKNPARWAEDYTTSLNNLAGTYSSLNQFEESVKLNLMALDIRKKLYIKNPNRWAEDYTTSLNNLAIDYHKLGQFEEAIQLNQKAIKILLNLYQVNPKQWVENYTRSLNNLAVAYSSLNYLDEALKLNQEVVDIRIKFYKENPELWSKDYAYSLNNLALSYYALDNTEEAFLLNQDALLIFKHLYKCNPNRWADDYIIASYNLSNICYKIGKLQRALNLMKEAYELRLQHFGKKNLYTKQFKNYYESLKQQVNRIK